MVAAGRRGQGSAQTVARAVFPGLQAALLGAALMLWAGAAGSQDIKPPPMPTDSKAVQPQKPAPVVPPPTPAAPPPVDGSGTSHPEASTRTAPAALHATANAPTAKGAMDTAAA